MNRALPFTLVGLAVVIVAGCGGKERPTTSDARWVSSLCGGAAKWDSQVERAYEAAYRPGTTRPGAVEKLAHAVEIIVDEARALPRPATAIGQRGRELVDAWAARFENRASEMELAFRQLPEGADEERQRSAVAKFHALAYDRPARVIPFVGIAVGGELRELFRRTAGCSNLLGWHKIPVRTNSPHELVPGERWATRVCRRLTAHENALLEPYADVHAMRKFPSVVTRNRVLADIGLIRRAIREVIADLRAIPPPNLPKGPQAKKLIDALASSQLMTADDELARIRARVLADPARDAIVGLLGGDDGLSGLQGTLFVAEGPGGFDVVMRNFHKPRAAAAFRAAKACYRS